MPDGAMRIESPRRIDVRTFYRTVAWLPIAAPAAVWGVTKGFGWRLDSLRLSLMFQTVSTSLFYGGIPYLVLALWGCLAITRMSEADIERLMQRAPLLMAGLVLPFYLAVGIGVAIAAGTFAPLEPFLTVGIFGAFTAIPVGYIYVGIVMALRRLLGQWLNDAQGA